MVSKKYFPSENGDQKLLHPRFSPFPSWKGFVGIAEHARVSIVGIISSPKNNLDHGRKAPVYMMVPGFVGKNANMGLLGGHISEQANVVYVPQLPNFNTGSIAHSADILALEIEKVRSMNGISRDIRLLGYSLGGLISFKALQINTKLKVSQVITMGTPFFGTPIAYPLSPFLPACKDINKEGGYFAGCDFSNQIGRGGVIAHIGHKDSLVPFWSQFPGQGIAPGKVRRLDYWDYTHTCFVVGESAKTTAQRILGRK